MRRTLRAKLMTIIIILLVVLVGKSIWSISTFNKLSKSTEGILEDNYESVGFSQEMMDSLERQDSFVLAYLFNKDPENIIDFNDYNLEFVSALESAKANATEAGENELINNIANNYSLFITSTETMFNQEYDQSFYYSDIYPIFLTVKADIAKIRELNQIMITNLKNEAAETARSASRATIYITIFTILLGVYISYYLIKKALSPIYELIEKTKSISKGNYSQQIDIKGGDEVATLTKEFNYMSSQLEAYEQINLRNLMEEKQRAEAIVNSISDGLVVTDDKKQIILVNKAAERIFDIKQEGIVGEEILNVIDNQEIFDLIDRASKTDLDKNLAYRVYSDITYVGSKQEQKYYRIEARTVRGELEESIGEVTLVQDITKLKELDQLKSQFILTAAHELRTPLTSIGMGSALLLENIASFNADQIEIIEAIKEDQERLTILVNDLLDLSRMEAGKAKIDIEKSDILEIINKTVDPLRAQAKEVDAVIEVDLAEGLPFVLADSSKISSVITNILSNALRYIPDDGSGKIEVKVSTVGKSVLVAIRDNGSGIPEEYQDRIFEKFVQVKQDVEKSGSSGLGLAISKEIITAHGGKIWVKSEIGKGSTFFFTLKVYPEEQEKQEKQEAQ